MNKNVMCVTVCGNTTNIGLYDVELGDNSIRYLRFNGYQTEKDLKIREVSELILKIQSQMMLDLIIIDCRAVGIAIADELEKRKCNVPVHKAYINKQLMSDALVRVHNLIQENLIEVSNDIDVRLDKFNITYNADNLTVMLLKSDYDNVFSNISMLSIFGYTALSDMFKIDKRERIENNLNEILWILIDDLKNIKYLDSKEIEKLTRLMDKVNYIRGQY